MNTKNKKIVLILVAAVIVAVIGGFALYNYLMPKKTTVYVFRSGAKSGDVVTESMLTPVQADSKIIVAGQSTDINDQFVTGETIEAVLKSGDSLRMDVSAGMPLTLSLLTANGGSDVEMNMDPTKIAITIPISGINGVTNDLKSGSRVNIYVTGNNSAGEYSTTLVFQNMRILTVTKDDGGGLVSATIETSIDESLELVHYANSYALYLGLIDNTGYEYSPVDKPSFTPGGVTNYQDASDAYLNTEAPVPAEDTPAPENTEAPADGGTDGQAEETPQETPDDDGIGEE